MFKTLTLTAMIAAFSLPAMAEDVTVGDLMITDTWMRATTSVARSTGGFFTVHNHGDNDERLLSASADFAMVQVHETVMQDGVNRMQEQADGIVIPAGGSVSFAPGAYHLMLMGLETGLPMGEERQITLLFENAGEVVLNFEAEMRQGAAAQGHDMDHGEMDHDTMDHGDMEHGDGHEAAHDH